MILLQFEKDGYAVIENFATAEECDELRTAILQVIDGLDVEKEHKTIFSTRQDQSVSFIV